MSIRVRWHDDDHQLLIVQFTSHWTWNEFFRAKATMDNLLDHTNEHINCICLVPSDLILPPDSIRNGKHAFAMIHPNLNHIVIARSNILIRTIYKMVSKQSPTIINSITLAESQDHAMQFLETLPQFK